MSRKHRNKGFHPKQKSHSKKGGHHGPPSHAPKPKASTGQIEKVGIVQGNEKGFGFFIPEDGSTDAFLPPREMKGILSGDTIRARITKDSRKEDRFAAVVLSVVKRAHPTIVGVLSKTKAGYLLKPDDQKVIHWVHLDQVPPDAKEGQKAVARITQWPGEGKRMKGHVEEILGFAGDPGVDILAIVKKYKWNEKFPPAVEHECKHFPENPSEEDWKGRLDLRDTPVLTIDGPDAKDFDDAISLVRESSGRFRLGVHIADVSHYVREGTPLDQEAQERATSVYLPDRVLPMLPHSLSDGLCSLREGVPRLTLSAFLEYGPEGKLLGTEFAPTVIQSARRGTYEEVQQVLDGTAPPAVRVKYERLRSMLADMLLLSRNIRAGRREQGSMDFDLPEVRAVMGPDGLVQDIRKVERLETHRLIEDFMVAANEAVATYVSQKAIPALYRIHEPPQPPDLEDLTVFLKAYHVHFKPSELGTPRGLSALLESVKGNPLGPLINMLALRSMKLAVYSTKNLGHFGLALRSYCHFTSPIRRYPDLVVHRALKKTFQARESASKAAALDRLAAHCSERERSAEKAEREGQKVMQLRFMQDKIGRDYSGPVRHMTAYGVYVELEPYGLEGFLPLENMLEDGLRYDQESLTLKGNQGTVVRFGDILKVKVLAVDMLFQRLILTRNHGG